MAQDQDVKILPPVDLAGRPAPLLAAGGQGGALAPLAKAKPRRSVRSLILPAMILAALGFGGYKAYDWFVSGRFLISTDDAYIGTDTAIIAAKVAGHIALVAIGNNSIVHTGDLLVKIDDGDYQLAVAAAKDKIATQDATVDRIGQQIGAQRAVIAQTQAQVAAARAQLLAGDADRQRAALEFERSQKLAEFEFRLAAASGAGDGGPRAHRGAAGRRRRLRERGRSRRKRRQGQSRCPGGAKGRSRAHARRTPDRSRQGAARPQLRDDHRAVRRRGRQQSGGAW